MLLKVSEDIIAQGGDLPLEIILEFLTPLFLVTEQPWAESTAAMGTAGLLIVECFQWAVR